MQSKALAKASSAALPDFAWEWIGKAVADRLDEIELKHAETLSKLRDLYKADLERERETHKNSLAAMREMFEGELCEAARKLATIAEDAKALVGPTGPQGEAGEPGKDGAPGRDGLPGLPGRDGALGPQGEKGLDGKDGRDAVVSLELLAEAFKGVWTAGEYERGALVVFGGSLFMALEKTEQKPETGEGWRLIVKRGRDGKDGKDGRHGEKGERGPMGHYKGVE